MAYPTNYDGSLRPNEVYESLYNMIISQQVFADNLKFNDDFINRVDGSMWGDTKLYYATNALAVYDWGGDAEATKLLELDRPEAPKCQAITLDTFKQIRLSLDNYLTKRAWMDENAFGSFSSIMLGWMGDTKKVYDRSLNKVARGTYETAQGSQEQTITLPTDANNKEAENRLQSQAIATKVEDIFTELEDESSDFNDYENLRSYSRDDFDVIFNSAYANKITKMDLPTIYHKDGLVDVSKKLPAKYFGDMGVVNTNAEQTADGRTIRMLKPGFVTLTAGATIKGRTYKTGDKVFLFAGEIIPSGIKVASKTDILVPFYKENGKIICKFIHKKDLPYLSSFSAGTSFQNARALSDTRYTTFGHNSLQHLHNYPLITLKASAE